MSATIVIDDDDNDQDDGAQQVAGPSQVSCGWIAQLIAMGFSKDRYVTASSTCWSDLEWDTGLPTILIFEACAKHSNKRQLEDVLVCKLPNSPTPCIRGFSDC